LTLALGIGANTTIFSVLYATVLRRLPFPDPDQLVRLNLVTPPSQHGPSMDQMVWSFPKYETFRDAQKSFARIAAYSGIPVTIATSDGAERLRGETVSGEYFRVLGVAPSHGRDFGADEDKIPNAPRVALISESLWERLFSADPAIIGQTLRIDNLPTVVIGVVPREFRGLTGQAELWFNIASGGVEDLGERWSHWLDVVGRLQPDVTLAQAKAETQVLGGVVDAAHKEPMGSGRDGAWGAIARPLEASRVDPTIGRSITALGVAVALVLLLACVNLTGLLLARATARRREIAVRLALGARRTQVIRQLFVESTLLALLGGAAGIGLAMLGVEALRSFWTFAGGSLGNGPDLTWLGMNAIRLDPVVLGFAIGITVVTALLVGLLPALHASRADVAPALKDTEARPRRGLFLPARDLLVVAEIALAAVLLAGSGLMLKSLGRLLSLDTGVDARNVLSLRMAIPPSDFRPDSASLFYSQILDQVAQVPGVSRAAIGNCAPLNGGCNGTIIWFRDRPAVPEGSEPQVGVHFVSPDWFATLGVPLRAGRVFSTADVRGSPKVVVVNQAAAKKFWPNESPVGHIVAVGQGGFHERAEVIGVVGDVRFGNADDAAQPDVFISYLQSPRPNAIVWVKTTAPAAAVAPRIREVIHGLNANLPVFEIRPMEERVKLATVRQRFTSGVLTVFGGSALLLAIVGTYALIAWEVTRRTREIGIRMTLGARGSNVLRLILKRGALLAGVGLVIGLGAALGATRLLRSILYDTQPGDPATFAWIALLLGLSAMLATLVPAWRATRIEPVDAIKSE
ncbi:MAG TPA: ABC transporter permease, partial [Gemmatimonadales bacterium]|nr:ABC transporter permease [Gemmatimonadales bacterium]